MIFLLQITGCISGRSKRITLVLCVNESETIDHLFYTCTQVKRLWEEIEAWFSRKVDVKLDKMTVFLGSDDALTHTVIMTAKQYIFNCKCKEKIPSFIGFYSCLMYVKKMELYNATHMNVRLKIG